MVLFIDIIQYREDLTDMVQLFTLYTVFVLTEFSIEILSKSYTDFDSDKITFADFAH